MTDRPVVLCVDGSRGSLEAIGAAASLLAGRRAIVLNVVESLSPAVFMGAEGDATAPPSGDVALHVPSVEAAKRLVQVAVEAAQLAGFDALPIVDVTPGRTSRRIVEIAEEHDAEVIVVGARGRSSLASILLGSVSHEVVQHAGRPVLVVHGSGARTAGGA